VFPTVETLLKDAVPPLGMLDAQVLLCWVLGKSREYLLSHPDHVMTRRDLREWRRVRDERENGRPVAYITHRKEFYSLTFYVDEGVLIPRPETETLVDQILQASPESLLDMGTGSGIVAIAVKSRLPGCGVTGVDKSRHALAVARRNARRIFGEKSVSFIRSDFFRSLGRLRFQVIACNPPYVKSGDLKDLPVEVLHEPVQALDGGADGLNAYRVLLESGHRHLEGSGRLMLEVDPALLPSILKLRGIERYDVEKTVRDLTGAARVLVLRGREGKALL
jgi:release factor glutamine methyltransferase